MSAQSATNLQTITNLGRDNVRARCRVNNLRIVRGARPMTFRKVHKDPSRPICYDLSDVLANGLREMDIAPTKFIPTFVERQTKHIHACYRLTDGLWHHFRWTNAAKARECDRMLELRASEAAIKFGRFHYGRA